jgi:hypothetical protein
LVAQGFFAAQGFLAAQGFFAAQGLAALLAQGFLAAQGVLLLRDRVGTGSERQCSGNGKGRQGVLDHQVTSFPLRLDKRTNSATPPASRLFRPAVGISRRWPALSKDMARDMGQTLARCQAAQPSRAALVARSRGRARMRRIQPRAVMAAIAALAGGSAWLAEQYGPGHGALLLIGAGLGLVLQHAAFGFTRAYRRLVTVGDGAGVRAQLVMLALATVLFAPHAGLW